MATIKKQYYGIKFPFTANNEMEFFIDLNTTLKDKVASEIAHVLLTPKRSRIRKPDFGTDLIKYIFEPNDELTWEGVEKEAKESISKYVSNTELTKIDIIRSEKDPNAIYLDLRYSVKKGKKVENNRTVIKL